VPGRQKRRSGRDCTKKSFFSLRLPIEALRDALQGRNDPVATAGPRPVPGAHRGAAARRRVRPVRQQRRRRCPALLPQRPEPPAAARRDAEHSQGREGPKESTGAPQRQGRGPRTIVTPAHPPDPLAAGGDLRRAGRTRRRGGHPLGNYRIVLLKGDARSVNQDPGRRRRPRLLVRRRHAAGHRAAPGWSSNWASSAALAASPGAPTSLVSDRVRPPTACRSFAAPTGYPGS
jgi:hypothetical protein